jgi:CBS domain-containing protein
MPGPADLRSTAHVESHSDSDRTRTVNRLELGMPASLDGSRSLLASNGEGGPILAERQEQTEMNTKQPPLVDRRMSFIPYTVEPSDSVAHARALLDERRIKHLPVMSNERLVGIVSAHDLEPIGFSGGHSGLAKAVEEHPDRVRINSVMTTDVRTVQPSDNLAYAAQLMRRAHIGALPVLEQGRLAGIISRSDLLDVLGPDVKAGGHMTKKNHSGARGSKSARLLSLVPFTPNATLLRRLTPVSGLRARHSVKH